MDDYTLSNSNDSSAPDKPKRQRVNEFDTASAMVLTITALLVSVIFIPSEIFSFSLTKGIFLSLGVLGALILWIIGRLKDNTLELPQTPLLWVGGAVVLVYGISSLFSLSPGSSLVGYGFEIDTFASVFIAFLLFSLIPIVFKNKQKIGKLYGYFFIAIMVVSLYQILRLIVGPGFMSGGVMTSPISNMIGSWNDLGVFYGLVAIISLTAIEFLPAKKALKLALYALLAVAFFFLALVNFMATWIVVGLLGLLFFVYTLSFGSLFASPGANNHALDEEGNRVFGGVSVTSLLVFVVSLVFVLSQGALGDSLAESLGIAHIDARPSLESTLAIAGDTLRSNPLLGVGPGQFVHEWLQNKPIGVNTSVFWNIDFTSGIGALPSSLVTVGALGFLAWVAFIGMFIVVGFRGIIRSLEDEPFSRYLSISSFLCSLYLWVFFFLYVPGIVIFSLAFIFSGIFVAVQFRSGYIPGVSFSFIKNPRAGFIAVLVIVLLLISSVSGMYFLVQNYVAHVNYERGISIANTGGSLDDARSSIVSAIRLREKDLYYRTLSQLYLVELGRIAQSQGESADTLRARFQAVLGSAVDSANRATELDPSRYQNWVSKGQVYEAIVPLGIPGAYESAVEAYERALELNPQSPALYLTRARLALAKQDLVEARSMITRAIELKNNYSEAVFLLSQIEASEGNIENAVKAVEAVSLLAPTDPTIFFQLGLLRYNLEDYTGALSALDRAVRLRDDYSNARYFLGLSYYEVGREDDALAQFEAIARLNPDNREVSLILANLKAGNPPLANAEPPFTTDPLLRDELPIEEELEQEAVPLTGDTDLGIENEEVTESE